MNKKEDFVKFTSDLINKMDIPEEQKLIMGGIMNNTIENLTDNNLDELEGEVVNFLKKQYEKQGKLNVFD